MPLYQSPLRGQSKSFITVHDHFLMQWQLNWRLDWLLCKTMSCFWTEYFTLISLNPPSKAWRRADMLTTGSGLLPFCPPPTALPVKALSGVGGGGKKGARRDKSLSSPLPYGDSCRVILSVAACLYPQSTRQWHADSRAWHQVSSQCWANPVFSTTEETQLHRLQSL